MLIRLHLQGPLSVTSLHRTLCLDWKPEYWDLIGMDFENSNKRNHLETEHAALSFINPKMYG